MNKGKILLAVLAIAFGIFMVVYGERDDSPGAQGLGLLLAIAGIAIVVRSKKKS
jgi:hypothetical protein